MKITSEVFPTHLRSTGPGFCQNVGKGIGGLAGPIVAASLLMGHGYVFVLTMPGVFFLALALLIWTLPRADARAFQAVEADDYLTRAAD